MMKTMLLATAAALALTAGAAANSISAGASQISAGAVRGTAHREIHAPPPGLATLYDQNIGDGQYGWVSQTLSSYPQYDEYVADDFIVPAGHSWKIRQIDVTGEYSPLGSGPASSVNVLFWKDKHHLPGATAKVECDNLTPSAGLSTGAFQIKIPKGCKVHLKGGTTGATYWVTVQANMQGANTSGYWAWQTNTNVANNVSAGWWYGGGVSVPPECAQAWGTLTHCAGFTVDFAFALLGKDKT